VTCSVVPSVIISPVVVDISICEALAINCTAEHPEQRTARTITCRMPASMHLRLFLRLHMHCTLRDMLWHDAQRKAAIGLKEEYHAFRDRSGIVLFSFAATLLVRFCLRMSICLRQGSVQAYHLSVPRDSHKPAFRLVTWPTIQVAFQARCSTTVIQWNDSASSSLTPRCLCAQVGLSRADARRKAGEPFSLTPPLMVGAQCFLAWLLYFYTAMALRENVLKARRGAAVVVFRDASGSWHQVSVGRLSHSGSPL